MEDDEAESLSSSNPNQALAHSETTAMKTKQAAMLERLANRHQTRLEASLSNRSSESDSSVPPSFESTDSFLSRFADSKRSVESRIIQCRNLGLTSDASQVRTQLDAITDSVSDLEKLVAENSYFLPSYEVRSSLKSISDLKQSLEILSSELVPKKKFSFKNKTAKKERDQPIEPSSVAKLDITAAASFIIPESPGFRSKTGEVLVRRFTGSEIGEFTISDLDSCEVRLFGCVRALFVHRLRNCRIYGGPVTASILIDGVEDCVFAMASHQIRIHHAKGTDFYLRVRSRPIIEDSERVRFAPYCLSYDGIDGDLESSGLDEETGNWANVDDFRWLRAVQSPNWSVLPENERIRLPKITDSENQNEEM